MLRALHLRLPVLLLRGDLRAQELRADGGLGAERGGRGGVGGGGRGDRRGGGILLFVFGALPVERANRHGVPDMFMEEMDFLVLEMTVVQGSR